MKIFLLMVLEFCLTTGVPGLAAPAADVAQHPDCRLCGMDREKFAHSRMLIVYADGSQVATCSLHCTAVELANTMDRLPIAVEVADYASKALIDAETAVWVLGGEQRGVMTGVAKWAFASTAAAERFIQSHGGRRIDFDTAIKAAYDDMYQDSKMIREFREMQRNRQPSGRPR